MKLIQVLTFYPEYIDRFYAKHPSLLEQSYYKQKSALEYDGFGWADFWIPPLRSLGYEADVFFANAEPLQKAWADENGFSYSKHRWLFEISKEQIVRAKPDILFVEDYVLFTKEWLDDVRAACPSIKLVVGACGAPFSDGSIFKSFDLVFSCIPEFVENFKKNGVESILLPHAFESRILERVNVESPVQREATFIGQIVRGRKFHVEREKILEAVVDKIPISIYSPSAETSFSDDVKAVLKKGAWYALQGTKFLPPLKLTLESLPTIGPRAKRLSSLEASPPLPVSRKLRPFMKPPVFGLDMFSKLQTSQVTLNHHIDASPRFATNMRLFEATGMGACLLTDWKENIADLFVPDSEIVTYKTPQECVEKLSWLLKHPEKAIEIAMAGQKRTLRDHTFEKRMQIFDKAIKEMIG